MADAGKTRDIGARTVMGMTILTAVFLAGGAQRSWAQSAPAPIVYAAPASKASSPNGPVAFDQFQGRSTFEDRAIDLRPGAIKASFGPAPLPASRLEQQPAKSVSGALATYAEPYAGPPYQVEGKWYVPTYEPNYDEVGIASWYGPTFHGKDSASGEVFDENAMTAAHPTLPIPSLVRVTNLENGKSVIVRLNDRGPFVDDRIIDLSKKAGASLGMRAKGTAKVRVQYVGPAPAVADTLPAQPVRSLAMATAPTEVPARTAPIAQPIVLSHPASEPVPTFVNQPLPAPVRAVAAPPQPVDSQHGYFLQAGSFADPGNAHALRDKLDDLGRVSIVAANVNGTDFYRVMIGPWPSRTEAERAQGRLVETGTRAIIVARLDR